MNVKFSQLDEVKKDRIINAALKVFSESDYKNASTDEIVKEAGISKGALFYYFKNKKLLYEFLFNYVIEYLTNEIFKFVDLNETDFLVRISQVLQYKANIIRKYPHMIHFVLKLNQEKNTEIQVDLLNSTKDIHNKAFDLLVQNIDTTKFREDINLEHAINTVIFTSESFSNRFLNQKKDLDEMALIRILEEFNGYLSFFKKCFYKGES